MQKLFNKILVPVDFSSTRSQSSLEKAIAVAIQYNCSIDLLHVITLPPFSAIAMFGGDMTVPFAMIDNRKELEFQLEKLCRYIRGRAHNPIKVEYTIVGGEWNRAIVDFVQDNKIDLILIERKGRMARWKGMQLNPDCIAEKANVPVITIPVNRRITGLYSIVIPITDFLPVRKLMYALYMSFSYDTTINLLGIENSNTKERLNYYLTKTSELVRENCAVKVEMDTVAGDNVAEAVNQFTMRRSVNLIILNPDTQTKMPGFFSSLLGSIIQKYSATPVLTVNRLAIS